MVSMRLTCRRLAWPILFAPDQNLLRWVQRQSGRELTLWPGTCIVHETFSEQALLQLKLEHPGAEVLAHPECQQHLLDLADSIGSTSKLLHRAEASPADSFIVLTEPGILHQMRKAVPDKAFYEVPGADGCSCNACPYMRLNTLEKLWGALARVRRWHRAQDLEGHAAAQPSGAQQCLGGGTVPSRAGAALAADSVAALSQPKAPASR
jgi:quinolinate synthetase A subunit